MMCFEINESQVEGDLEQHSEEKKLEVHREAQLEQSLSLQDWLNGENQLHVTNQSHTFEVRLEHQSQNELHMNEV